MSLNSLLLLLAAWIGHTAILTYCLNWLYGHALPRPFLKGLRSVLGALVVAFPAILWWAAFNPQAPFETASSTAIGLGVYVVATWVVALGALPLVLVRQLTRRRPAALTHETTQTVNVAADVGYRPIAHGKRRLLAHLPGNEVFHVDLVERTLCLPGVPAAWDGVTILHLSDLHLCGCPDLPFYRRVMDLCRGWEPDLVALTGDIVDSDWHHRWIVPVLGRLRWRLGAFAVLGNHDAWHDPRLVRRRLRRVGFRVLGNALETIEINGEPLVVVGHEGPWFAPAPDLSAAPAAGFRLCLSHTPDNIPWARRHGIDLMLAGHNHGGQVRLPLVGSILVPSRYSRRYDCGTFHVPPTVLHVSRGLGGLAPLRYFCRPEVTKLTLRSGKGVDGVVEMRAAANTAAAGR